MKGLTSATALRNFNGKERKNSEPSGTRDPKRGFFVPGASSSASGGRQRYNTRKGKTARRLGSVLTLPTPSGGCVRTAPEDISSRLGAVTMTHSPVPGFILDAAEVLDRLSSYVDGLMHLARPLVVEGGAVDADYLIAFLCVIHDNLAEVLALFEQDTSAAEVSP